MRTQIEDPDELTGGWVDIISNAILNALMGLLLVCLHAMLESR